MLVDSWKNIGLENCIKGMQEIKSEPMTFDKKQIDLFNEPIVADCRNFGYSSRFNSKQNLSELMSRASQHALIYLCNNILIENDFPVENSFSTKTPLGSIISEHLQKSIVGREYILMNNLDPKEFLFAYYESANSELQINISLFRKEKELFERLSKENKDLNLAKFNEIPCYADLCQLFPAIDSKILELGKKFNICPLKNDEGYIFSGRKEASTVLKSVIKCLVDKYDTLEVASDLICAYLILFDKKSLNIRNTTVHGNDYPFDQNRLCFNRKAALIALGIILDRIKTI